jgi:hypothetical protein
VSAAQFIRGILVATSIIAAVFFARFYRKSRDRFFALFSLAFGILALNWLGTALIAPEQEARQWVFVVRLLAFLVILAAIVDKNRGRGSS